MPMLGSCCGGSKRKTPRKPLIPVKDFPVHHKCPFDSKDWKESGRDFKEMQLERLCPLSQVKISSWVDWRERIVQFNEMLQNNSETLNENIEEPRTFLIEIRGLKRLESHFWT